MVWWPNEPIYGSKPSSKFIKENFKYLKDWKDAIEATGITLSELGDWHTVSVSPSEINEHINQLHLTNIDHLESRILRMVSTSLTNIQASVVNQFHGSAIVFENINACPFTGVNFDMPSASHITIKASNFIMTVQHVVLFAPICMPSGLAGIDVRIDTAANAINVHFGDNSNTPNLFTALWGSTYKVIEILIGFTEV